MDYILFKVDYKDIKVFREKLRDKTYEDLGLKVDEYKMLIKLNLVLLSAITTMEKEGIEEMEVSYPLEFAFQTVAMLYKLVFTNDIQFLLVAERLTRNFVNNKIMLK
jgi:hypothetical protein